MRRALVQAAPALSHVFGLRPWELDKLTFTEARVYLRALEDYQRSMKG